MSETNFVKPEVPAIILKNKFSTPGIILIAFSLIALLIVVIITSLSAHNFSLLNSSIDRVDSATKNKTLFEEVSNELLLAENEYRIFLFNRDTAARSAFTSHIQHVITDIDDVKKIADTTLANGAINDIKNEIYVEASLNYLELLSDSLLENIAAQPYKTEGTPAIKIERMHNNLLRQFYLSATDTIRYKHRRVRRSFFQKVGDLFSNRIVNDSIHVESAKGKNTQVSSSFDSTQDTADSLINALSNNIKDYYRQSVNTQMQFRNNIAEKEKKLALINISLLDKISAIFKGIRDQNMKELNDIISQNKANILRSKENLKRIAIFTPIFICILILLLVRNIRRNMVYEKNIIDARKKAENLSLMKGRFLSNMSHEIRSPLTSIIGFTEQIEKQKLYNGNKDYINAIQTASDHLLKLVNDILDFSKLEAGKINIAEEPFKPKKAIEEVAYSMMVAANKKNLQLNLNTRIEDDLIVSGDKMRLNQILYNLLSNAIKFTGKGRIDVSSNIRKINDKEISLSIVVEDTGIGILKNQLETIFEEFSQLDTKSAANETPLTRGTGLGLSICKMLVEQQHGTITVDSTQRIGSSFYVQLPYKLSTKEAFEEAEAQMETGVEESNIGKSKILIVEDNDHNIMLLSNIFGNNKIPFDIVMDGEQALKIFNTNNYSLVITDIFIPGISGIELTKMIRKNRDIIKAHKPVLAFTSNVLKEDIDIYYKAGITDCISKPTTEKDLIDKVKKYL
jgi:signal transduction histidine kinase/CheY-like chemotaxis protein